MWSRLWQHLGLSSQERPILRWMQLPDGPRPWWSAAQPYSLPGHAGGLIDGLKKLLATRTGPQRTYRDPEEDDEHDESAQEQSGPTPQELSIISGIISRVQLDSTDPDAPKVLTQVIDFLAPLVINSSRHMIHADDQVMSSLVQPHTSTTSTILAIDTHIAYSMSIGLHHGCSSACANNLVCHSHLHSTSQQNIHAFAQMSITCKRICMYLSASCSCGLTS